MSAEIVKTETADLVERHAARHVTVASRQAASSTKAGSSVVWTKAGNLDPWIVGDMWRPSAVQPCCDHFAEEGSALFKPAAEFPAIRCLSPLSKQAVDRNLPRDLNFPNSAVRQFEHEHAAFRREFHG